MQLYAEHSVAPLGPIPTTITWFKQQPRQYVSPSKCQFLSTNSVLHVLAHATIQSIATSVSPLECSEGYNR